MRNPFFAANQLIIGMDDSWTRRDLLQAGALAGGMAAGGVAVAVATSANAQAPQDSLIEHETIVPVSLRVNGLQHAMTLVTRVTLLDALREHLRTEPEQRKAAITASAALARSW